MLSEKMRLEVPALKKESKLVIPLPFRFIQDITTVLSRSNESDDIIWAPITLSIGAALPILLFQPETAAIGITCMALGDTAAMLAGNKSGSSGIPSIEHKRYAGALACWFVCTAVIWGYYGNLGVAVAAGAAGAFVESLQFYDADNILLPLSTALCIEIGMHYAG